MPSMCLTTTFFFYHKFTDKIFCTLIKNSNSKEHPFWKGRKRKHIWSSKKTLVKNKLRPIQFNSMQFNYTHFEVVIQILWWYKVKEKPTKLSWNSWNRPSYYLLSIDKIANTRRHVFNTNKTWISFDKLFFKGNYFSIVFYEVIRSNYFHIQIPK